MVEKKMPKTVQRTSSDHNDTVVDWRAATIDNIRTLINEADPKIQEEQKWMKPANPEGVPVWSRGGIVCTGETYKQVVKLTFPRGASLPDPRKLFNASLDGGTRRAIDIRQGDTLNATVFKSLIRAAVAVNLENSKGPVLAAPTKKPAPPVSKMVSPRKVKKSGVVLLSGGNPQIAKAEGDIPVQAYIAAMPGWKRELGKQLDRIITEQVPNVGKAVKWNSPFYGVEGQGWFLSYHVFTRYVKVTFFQGKSLLPVPPGATPKSKDARWIDLHEGDVLDEVQFSDWLQQAAALPGWLA